VSRLTGGSVCFWLSFSPDIPYRPSSGNQNNRVIE
jgi:hypothetical protein